jgi:hypothetical protein
MLRTWITDAQRPLHFILRKKTDIHLFYYTIQAEKVKGREGECEKKLHGTLNLHF